MYYVKLPNYTKIGPFASAQEAGQWVRTSPFSRREVELITNS